MKTILFFGDSITYYGEFKNGYIHLINLLLRNDSPQHYKAIGAGRGGDKVEDLLNRKEELFSLSPSIVFIYIGINDVWHFPPQPNLDRQNQFKLHYKELIENINSQTKAEIVLCTLSVIGEARSGNSYDAILDAYSECIKEISFVYQLRLCDLRQAFTQYLDAYNQEDKDSGILTYDGVHLNDRGNQLVADSIYPILTTIIN